ncbi:MAG: hypothetical protein EA379_10490 [Phycisphaerales bacterium]|nr:MAG: hypothetical protein EA379_10490 [Phycisphaerales bacterium]
MPRSLAPRLFVLAVVLCVSAPAAMAQNTFFQIFNGRINSSEAVSVRNGDRVVVRVQGSGSFTAIVDAAGEFSGLTITRDVNEEVPMTFEFRRGGTTYALVPSPGATDQLVIEFTGFNNPLSAAFNAQTITAFVGPRLSGGGGDPTDPDGPAGDPADVDRDGRITVNDALLVMRYITGNRDGTIDPARLDVTGDGRITTDDVVAILRRVGEVVEVPDDDDGDGEGAPAGAGMGTGTGGTGTGTGTGTGGTGSGAGTGMGAGT